MNYPETELDILASTELFAAIATGKARVSGTSHRKAAGARYKIYSNFYLRHCGSTTVVTIILSGHMVPITPGTIEVMGPVA